MDVMKKNESFLTSEDGTGGFCVV